MEKEKIGLLNIQHCDSHGAVLLAYALETVLKRWGYTVSTIDYKYAGRIVERNVVKKLVRKFLIKWKKQFHLAYVGETVCGQSVKKEYDSQHENFESFRTAFLHLTREIADVNDEILNSYDVIIVGSDVVWKPEIARCIDREIYFLRSPEERIKKIAYAASIGTSDERVLNEHEKYYAGAFDALDFISVREKSSIPFIKKFASKPVDEVIDPVFLLETNDYTEIEKEPAWGEFKDYIYLYLIGENENAIKLANEFASRRGSKILLDLNCSFELSELITVPCMSAISAGPQEFLYNIRNASYVITDSFHTTAFSILYNKPFWVFNRGNISVRMSDLISTFGLNNRMSVDSLTEDKIEWDTVNQMVDEKRRDGMNWLYSALKDGKEPIKE